MFPLSTKTLPSSNNKPRPELTNHSPRVNRIERSSHRIIHKPGLCTPAQLAIIYEELAYAGQIASVASEHLTEGPYYKAFFPDTVTNRPDFEATMSARYLQMSMFPDPGMQHTLKITCDDTAKSCPHAYASMLDKPKLGFSRLNFCNHFFDERKTRGTV